jgi:hypothetical protein
LLDRVSFKKDQFSLFKLHLKLDRITADFTILNVLLTGNRGIEKHRNLLKAMRALEEVFVHGNETGEGVKS